jgi:S-adenosyl methyltransferase
MITAVTPSVPTDGLDTSTAHQARVYDYWLGGKENYAADRAAGDAVMQAYPGIVAAVRAQRAFLGQAVRFLAGEAGISQFLDIGTGIPTSDNTHEVAQATAPEARVVYVDKDPVVLAHAHALLTSGPRGATDYIDADLHATAAILDQAAHTLDFTRPVAVMLLGILQVIPDDDDPWEIVSQLMHAVAPGSHLAIAHPAADIATGPAGEAERRYNQHAAVPVTLRTHAEVSRFFTGLDLLEPGVVPVDQWRPPFGVRPQKDLAIYGGVGRKRG